MHKQSMIGFRQMARWIYPLLFALMLVNDEATAKGYLRQLETSKEPPNILFIVSEDNGPELSSYGAPANTPVLDRLAKKGVRFNKAFVPQAGCSPSRASFLTGLYPHQNGQIGLATWKYGMYNTQTPNIVNALKEVGYRTGIIGKLHVNPAAAFNFDFQEIKGANFKRSNMRRYAAFAKEFMSAGDEPFYLQVNYPDAHDPFIPQVDGLPKNVLHGSDVEALPYMGVSSDELKQLTADYYNSIMRLDALVGDLLTALEDAGKAHNTLVVYIGDHGADLLRGKRTITEGGTRIPMIISWPGHGEEGKVYDGLVSTIDLFPTFLMACGVQVPDHLPGVSLVEVIGGSDAPVRDYLFTEYNVHSNHNPFPQRAVRDDRYKLVHNLVSDTNPGTAYTIRRFQSADSAIAAAPITVRQAYRRMANPPEYELYDLVNDPYEWNNLADDAAYQQKRKKLSNVLKRWQVETRDPMLDKELARRFFDEIMGTNEEKVDLRYHKYLNPSMSF